jgi:hypothetical protein
VSTDPTKYRAASAALRQALDRADRIVDQRDARGLTHVLLHDWRGHSLSERVTYELGEIVSDLLDQQAVTSLDALGAAIGQIARAIDEDRHDDARTMLHDAGSETDPEVVRLRSLLEFMAAPIGSALTDRDLRCDDCLRLLTPEGTCSCTAVTRG